MSWISRLKEMTTGKRPPECPMDGKPSVTEHEPLYKVGDLVRPRSAEFIERSECGGYLFFTGKHFGFIVYDEKPLMEIISIRSDGRYEVKELTDKKEHVGVFDVPFGGFEAATTRDFPHPTMGAVEAIDKGEQSLQTGGIHKWKRSVRVCGENLGEIIRLPFVKSVVPKNALDDENVGVYEYDGLPKKDTDGRFCIKTSLYQIPVGDSGWFVQDACGGWRWLDDKDYEEHKDDLITE